MKLMTRILPAAWLLGCLGSVCWAQDVDYRYPTVAVVVRPNELSDKKLDELERRLNQEAERTRFPARFHVTEQFVPVEYDYTVNLSRLRGFDLDNCGLRRTHYEWELLAPDEEVLTRRHDHKVKNTAQNIVRAVQDDWFRDR